MNKILLVDNDEMIRMLYRHELEEEGYDVFDIGDCTVVMAEIREKRPDLIVMEMISGKYNSFDLLRDIREKCPKLPVILCTAAYSFDYDAEFMAADFHVVKSASLEELKCRIKMAFRALDPFHGRTVFDGISRPPIPFKGAFESSWSVNRTSDTL